MNRQEQNLLLAKLLLQHIDAADGCNKTALQTLQEIDFIRQNYTKSTLEQYIVGTKQIKEGRNPVPAMAKGLAAQIEKLLNQPQPPKKTETPKPTINFGPTPQIVIKTPEQRIKEEMAKADKLKEQFTEKMEELREQKGLLDMREKAFREIFDDMLNQIEDHINECYKEIAAKELGV